VRSPAAGRALLSLQLLVAGSFALAAGAFVASWMAAEGQVPVWTVWVVATAMLALGAAAWLLLSRAAADHADAGMLQSQLQQALVRIETLTSSQGRFVGNIAHEIKSPLATVLSQVDLLLLCRNDPVAVEGYAKSIAEDMQHLADLVDSFLRLARPFGQDDTSHHIPTSVHEVVVDAVRRSQSLARERGVTVVPILAESGNGADAVEVLGDSVLLEAMVENLLRNAVRFAPRGSRVDVVVEAISDAIVVRVRDYGAGIAVEHLESVFDWFFDVSTRPDRSPGPGFGLAIAKRVAEHHDGAIELRNRAEGGCEFEIRLPRCRADQ